MLSNCHQLSLKSETTYMLTDSIFTTIFVNSDINYSYLAIRLERSASFASLIRLYVNLRISFVFALMKCSYAAFGEQNKTDNDSKCYSRHIYLRFSGCVI